MTAPARSMIIWMTRFIDRGSAAPPFPVGNFGRSAVEVPRTTTTRMAEKKIATDR